MDDYYFSHGGFCLTTAHPASHYGIPVLLDAAGRAYGPADDVSTPEIRDLFGPVYHAATLVYNHARNATLGVHPPLPAGVYAGMRLYLSQWPAGPQLPAEERRDE